MIWKRLRNLWRLSGVIKPTQDGKGLELQENAYITIPDAPRMAQIIHMKKPIDNFPKE